MLPEKLYVNRALQGIVILSLAIVGTIFILELISLYQERTKFSIYSPNTRWRIPLAMASLFGLVLFTIDGIDEWKNWTSAPEDCIVASAALIALFFILLKQSVNLFLYDHAKIVHEALQLNDRWLKWFRWMMWIIITVGTQAAFAWSYFLNFFGRVSVDGDCIFLTKYPEVIIAFAVSDACLNICMLLMFAAPLYVHVRQSTSDQNQASSKVRQLMKRNMAIALFVLTWDIVGLSTMTYFLTTVDHFDVNQEHLVLWGNFVAVTDQLVVIIGVHLMTVAWIPAGLRSHIHSWYLRTFHHAALNRVDEMSSVYVQSTTKLAALPPLEPGSSSPRQGRPTIAQLDSMPEQGVVLVGHDTVAAKLVSKRFGLWISSLSAKSLPRLLLAVILVMIEALDILVLVGVLPRVLSVVTGGILLAITVLEAVSWPSLAIVKMLVKRQAIIVRVVFWCLYLVFYNIVMQDERVVMGVAHCLFILLALLNDAFVKEASGYFGFAITCTACMMLIKRFILLQFDLIHPRFNDQVHILGNLLVWSIYQAARDFCFALLVLLLKDIVRHYQALQTSTFVHIQSAVIVRIIGLATEARMELANSKIMKKFGGIGLSSRMIAHTLKTSNVIEGGVLTLKERDSLAIRWFGLSRGERMLRFLGRPWIRWMSRALLAACLFSYVCLVLPGVLPPWVSFFMLLTLLPNFRTLLLKNWVLIRALVERVDFVMEAIFALIVLGLFGAMMKDERIVALPMLLLMWLDFRLSDAQCVFYHSAHRGQAYQSSSKLFFWHAVFTIILVLSLLAFPIILVLQLVSNVDSTLGFNLRGLDVNVTSAILDERDGAYAQVRLYQYVSDFLSTFAVIATIELLVDMIRNPKSQVSLKHFRASVGKVCVNGFVHVDGSADGRKNAAVTDIPTLVFSVEDEEEEAQANQPTDDDEHRADIDG